MSKDVEAAIAAYRRALTNTAELARTDLDEIEDHLRTLGDELHATGMPALDAVREAARRLGDPAELAREHARVRPPFGAKLSRTRAWSAAALLGVLLGTYITSLPSPGSWAWTAVFPLLELGCGIVLWIGLVARLSWARAILLGSFACFSTLWLVALAFVPGFQLGPITLAQLALVAFLAPWHRRDLSPAGVALALQVWAYAIAGSIPLTVQLSGVAMIAIAAATLATIGTVLRARWSAVFAVVSALAIAGATTQLASDTAFLASDMAFVALLATGAVAATISAVVQIATARSTLGGFAAVFR